MLKRFKLKKNLKRFSEYSIIKIIGTHRAVRSKPRFLHSVHPLQKFHSSQSCSSSSYELGVFPVRFKLENFSFFVGRVPFRFYFAPLCIKRYQRPAGGKKKIRSGTLAETASNYSMSEMLSSSAHPVGKVLRCFVFFLSVMCFCFFFRF